MSPRDPWDPEAMKLDPNHVKSFVASKLSERTNELCFGRNENDSFRFLRGLPKSREPKCHAHERIPTPHTFRPKVQPEIMKAAWLSLGPSGDLSIEMLIRE